MDVLKKVSVLFICCVCLSLSLNLNAQVLTETQILSRLNDVIRDKNKLHDDQIVALNTLIASANALRAETTENAIQAYKLLITTENNDFDPVKALGHSVLTLAVRSQDYRSQSFVLRAMMRYQAVASPNDILSTKQQLLGLLSRRLKDEEKAQILFDIGQADIQTGNVMSALDYLNRAQSAYWEQLNYRMWRKVVEQQIGLLTNMQWFDKALEKKQELVDFLNNQYGKVPVAINDQLLGIMAAEGQWPQIEELALSILESGADEENIQAQFVAGYWLMHVNLQINNIELVARWKEKLDAMLVQYPQLNTPPLFLLDSVTYWIEIGSLEQAKSLQNKLSIEELETQENAYLTIRQYLLNQVSMAASQADIEGVTEAYDAMLSWIDEERNRVLTLTMDQISQDFATMQQSTQNEIMSLNQTLQIEKESVGKEAKFNNMLLGIVALLTIIIAVQSFYYVRLKNKKQSSRRSRRRSSSY